MFLITPVQYEPEKPPSTISLNVVVPVPELTVRTFAPPILLLNIIFPFPELIVDAPIKYIFWLLPLFPIVSPKGLLLVIFPERTMVGASILKFEALPV